MLTDIVWITSENVNPVGRSRVDFGNSALMKFQTTHKHNQYCKLLGIDQQVIEHEITQKLSRVEPTQVSMSETRTRMESLLS